MYEITKQGFDIELITNGSLPTKSYVDKMIRAGLKEITLSLDSYDAKLHDSLRGFPGLFEKNMSMIKYIRENYPFFKININTVVMNKNLKQLKEIENYFSFADSHTFLLLVPEDNPNYNKLKLAGREDKKIYKGFVKNSKRDFCPPLKKEGGKLPICDQLFTKIKINSDGIVFPCDKNILNAPLNRPIKEMFIREPLKSFINNYPFKCIPDCEFFQ